MLSNLSVTDIVAIITSVLSFLSILIVLLFNYFRKASKSEADKPALLRDIIKHILEAETLIKGRKLGAVKLQHVLTSLNKVGDKKTIKKVNEVHAVIEATKDHLNDSLADSNKGA